MRRDLSNRFLYHWWQTSGLGVRQFARANHYLLGLSENAMVGRLWRYKKSLEKGNTVSKRKAPKRYPPVRLRAAVMDLETTDLHATGYGGHLICACILPLDREGDKVDTYALKFSDQRNDERLVREVIKALNEFDILVGHNIAGFDCAWLRTRAMKYDIATNMWFYYDTLSAAKRLAIKSKRKSLEFLADHFELLGENDKTRVLPATWNNIRSSDEAEFKEALDDIVYHCEQDVLINRQLFYILFPRDVALRTLPRVKG